MISVCFKHVNVHMDDSSIFRYEELNEQEFLNRFFECLSQAMSEKFDEYQFYVFSAKGSVQPASRALNGRNKVLIFVSDEMETKPIEYSSDYVAIFKAYLPNEESCAANNIYPFPLGVVNGFDPKPFIPIKDRSISVYFVGNLNTNRIPLFFALHQQLAWPLRALQNLLSVTALKRLALFLSKRAVAWAAFKEGKVEFTSGFKQGYDIKTYSGFIRDSKIVLCPKGFHASETFRHYEAMSAGCIVISEKLPDTGLYRESPIIQVDSWEEGVQIAKELLKKPDELAELHKEAVEWWNKNLSEVAASQYVKSTLATIRWF